jgi:hypothetical protein
MAEYNKVLMVMAYCLVGVVCGVYWETKKRDIKLDVHGVATILSMAALGPFSYIFGWIVNGEPLFGEKTGIILFKKRTKEEK